MILPYNWIITALRGNPKAGRQKAGNQASRQAEAPTPGQPASQLVGWLFGGFGWRLGRFGWRLARFGWRFSRFGRRLGGFGWRRGRCWGRSQILHNQRDSAIGRVDGIVRMTQLTIGK